MLDGAAPRSMVQHMRVSITLEDAVADQLEKAAAKEKRSVSSFVALLIEREFEAKSAAEMVSLEANAAAEIVGHEKTLSTLRALIEAGAETAAEKSA